MSDLSLDKYKYLWTDKRHEYVLIEFFDTNTKTVEYMIYHVPTKGGLLIENDEAYPLIITLMKEAGVPIRDKLPET